MEMVLNNGFCEMTMVEGGGFWSTVIEGVSNFLVNRIVWTNAKNMFDNFYVPIYPAGSSPVVYE